MSLPVSNLPILNFVITKAEMVSQARVWTRKPNAMPVYRCASCRDKTRLDSVRVNVELGESSQQNSHQVRLTVCARLGEYTVELSMNRIVRDLQTLRCIFR
jgi:hypothetical protein